MTNCPITKEISIHCDEPEQHSASEILNQLLKTNTAYINGELFELSEITDRIEIEDMRQAFQEDIEGNNMAVIKTYLNVILEIME